MNHPQLDFRTADPDEIATQLFANGCVLLRQFTPPRKVEALRDAAAPFLAKTTKPHVWEQEFRQVGLPTFSSFLFAGKHYALLDAVFGQVGTGSSYTTYQGTHTRRIAAQGGAGQPPLCWHIDAILHTFRFTVNFWVPFGDCGVNAPSLAVIPAPFDEVLEFVGYDFAKEGPNIAPEHHSINFTGPIVASAQGDVEASRSIAEHFWDRVWTPQYRVGDAMMLTNWTLHGTHSTPEMTEGRENAELRFVTGRTLLEMIYDPSQA